MLKSFSNEVGEPSKCRGWLVVVFFGGGHDSSTQNLYGYGL